MFRHFDNMMELYIIENYRDVYPQFSGRELTDRLAMDCLAEYGIEADEIYRTAKEKPYVEADVHFSVSHSGDYFVCIIADCPVGIDVQERRKTAAVKIAERYFTKSEQEYVERNGEDGFFRLWTRKEAYSKLTGEGIGELMRRTDVLYREDVEFTDFQIEDGMYCSCCMVL